MTRAKVRKIESLAGGQGHHLIKRLAAPLQTALLSPCTPSAGEEDERRAPLGAFTLASTKNFAASQITRSSDRRRVECFA